MLIRKLSTAFLLLLSILTTAVLALGLAAPASAHSELISSSPEDGAELEQAPAEIVLEFNEDIEPIGTEVAVVDPEGTPVSEGEVAVEGAVVTQAITGGAAGAYTVTWRAVSADGHPITGEYTFTVLEPATTEPETTEPTTEAETTDATTRATTESAAAGDAGSEDAESSAGPAAPILIGIVAVVIAGVVVLLVRRRRAR